MKLHHLSALSVLLAAASAVPLEQATTTVSAAAPSSTPTLPAEETVLTEADVKQYPQLQFGEELSDVEIHNSTVSRRSGRSCKVIPGDRNWPSNGLWSILNFFVGGKLIKPDPIAKVCYAGSTYDEAKCGAITSNWTNSDLHVDHPTSIMSTLYQGMTCLPGDASILGHTCTLGGYPVYVVDARNARDIQAAVNFARNMNIRLVIKNTGHDFHGKASGFGSLSIRTHALKDIAVIKNYRSKKYTGPAIKAGSGVQGFELYQAASDAGLMVVGGEGMTVGWGGGYIQGGGHSPLSSIHGMAADQVLSYEVVLANGRFVTADADTNPDLFWAMRGGGGSTFGVLVSITVKAFPDVPVTVSTFTFDPSAADVAKYALADTSNDDFWAVVKEYFSQFATHAGQGIYSYFNIFPSAVAGSQTFTMIPFFAPNKTAAEVDALLASTVAKAKEHNITLVPKTVTYSGFQAAWKAGFPKETIGMWNVQSGSRLFPRENWENTDKFEMQFNAIREVTMNSYMLGFNIAPTLANGQVTADETAVLPAWRETLMHAITGTMWDATIRDLSVVRSIQKVFTDGNMKKWRDVSPGSGAYLAECDFNEPDHQTAFWGTNYPKLYQMKQKYDPRGVFFAETAVGSEDWSAGVDRIGRLCPV